MVRLDATERAALTDALQGVRGDVFLFGSRCDPARRGGDIDVMIVSDADPYRLSLEIGARFFKQCESKLDVVVMPPAGRRTPDQQAFFRTLKRVRFS